MIITLVLLLIIIGILLRYLIKSAFSKPENFPPGPPSLPIWGAYWIVIFLDKWISNSFDMLGKFYNTKIVGCYLGPFPVIAINDYNLIREALTMTQFDGRLDLFVARFRSYFKRLGIFFTDGDNWEVQRRFALRHMRDYGFGCRSESLESTVNNEINEMINICLKPEYPAEKEIVKDGLVLLPDIFSVPFINPILAVFTQETLPRAQYKTLWDFTNNGLLFVQNTDDTGRSLNLTPWLKDYLPEYTGYNNLIKSCNWFLNFYENITKPGVESYDKNQSRHFIDQFISTSQKDFQKHGDTSFTTEQLVVLCVDFTLPASVGTTTMLSALIERLLVNPEVQTKIHEEIDRVVGIDRIPTLDDRQNMPYTEACIRETMRMETLVPLNIPHRTMEDTTLGGYDISANTAVLFNLAKCHYNKEIWGDPENFRPERFFGDDGKLCLNKDKSMPFGFGKRLCPGETFSRQTMFQVLAGFMQAFKVSTADGKAQTKLRERIPGLITSLPKFRVKVTPRNRKICLYST